MTKRDRRLLGLSCTALALVVALQYLVLPAMEEKSALEDRFQTLTLQCQQWRSRLHALTYLDEAAEQRQAELDALAAPYGVYLTTEQMDAAITSLLLDHGLFPTALTLQPGYSGTVAPYLSAKKGSGKTSENTPYDGVSLAALAGQEGVTAQEITEKGEAYFYIGSAALTAAGTEEAWLGLLDDVSANAPGLRVCAFTIVESGTECVITASMEFYMREGE